MKPMVIRSNLLMSTTAYMHSKLLRSWDQLSSSIGSLPPLQKLTNPEQNLDGNGDIGIAKQQNGKVPVMQIMEVVQK